MELKKVEDTIVKNIKKIRKENIDLDKDNIRILRKNISHWTDEYFLSKKSNDLIDIYEHIGCIRATAFILKECDYTFSDIYDNIIHSCYELKKIYSINENEKIETIIHMLKK